jgi:hypothetical protein
VEDQKLYSAIEDIVLNRQDVITNLANAGREIRVLKNDRNKQVISFFFPPAQKRLVLKIAYLRGNVLRRFFRSFGGSACRKEFERTDYFFRQGFNVPQPIVWGEVRKWGWLIKSYLICQEIESATTLGNYLAGFSDRADKEKLREKRQVIRILAGYLGRLHQRFIYHCDLRNKHILIKPVAGEKSIFLIDCEATRIYSKANEKILIWDLRKLRKSTMDYFKQGRITQTDRLRFFKEYVKYNPEVAEKFKYYASQITRLADEWDD